MKFLKLLFILFVFLFLSQTFSFADSDFLVKGDYRNAYIEYKKALDKEQTPINYLNMCRITFSLNDVKTAKSYCTTALNLLDRDKNPDSELKSNVLSTLGYIYSNAFVNNEVSFEYFNQAKELKEHNPDTDKYELSRLYLNIGYTYLLEKDLIAARSYLNKVLKIAEQVNDKKIKIFVASAYKDLGVAELQEKNYPLSKVFFDKAIFEIESAGIYKNPYDLGLIYLNFSDYYAAVKDKANELNARINAARYFDDLFYMCSNNEYIKKEPTNEDINNALDVFPYDNVASYYKILAFLKKEKFSDAENIIKRMTVINKYSNLPLYYAASAYAERYVETKEIEYRWWSRQYLKKFLENYPSKYQSNYLLMTACLYLDLNLQKEAENLFNKALKNLTYDKEVYTLIAEYYYKSYLQNGDKKYALSAVDKYEKAIEQGKINDKYLLNLATLYFQLGMKDKLEALWQNYSLKKSGAILEEKT